MPANNPEYYARRAKQSRTLAETAAEPYVKRIHLQMAADYDALAELHKPLSLRIVSDVN